MNHAYYNGSLIYEGTSKYALDLKGYFLNNTQESCKDYCEFYFEEIDNGKTVGKLSGQVVNTNGDVRGYWTKAESSKKLVLKLDSAKPFDMNQYLVK
ncbi:MAG: hypothetical protein OHK0017_06650 [Patescibacteria group bacterium]